MKYPGGQMPEAPGTDDDAGTDAAADATRTSAPAPLPKYLGRERQGGEEGRREEGGGRLALTAPSRLRLRPLDDPKILFPPLLLPSCIPSPSSGGSSSTSGLNFMLIVIAASTE